MSGMRRTMETLARDLLTAASVLVTVKVFPSAAGWGWIAAVAAAASLLLVASEAAG